MYLIAIIQARMGSTRLPGKVLKDIYGKTMLARVINRASRSKFIDDIIVATTTKQQDDPIVGECNLLQVNVFRGSENDVLDRYYQAARCYDADAIVRITSDCPLIDYEIIDKVIKAFIDSYPDYASNTLKATYPRGLDVEVFTSSTLERAWLEASKLYQRVHVTPYIYQNPNIFNLISVMGEEDYSYLRWTVDTPEDLELVRVVYDRMGKVDGFSWKDVISLIRSEPDLSDINSHIRQKSLEEC